MRMTVNAVGRDGFTLIGYNTEDLVVCVSSVGPAPKTDVRGDQIPDGYVSLDCMILQPEEGHRKSRLLSIINLGSAEFALRLRAASEKLRCKLAEDELAAFLGLFALSLAVSERGAHEMADRAYEWLRGEYAAITGPSERIASPEGPYKPGQVLDEFPKGFKSLDCLDLTRINGRLVRKDLTKRDAPSYR